MTRRFRIAALGLAVASTLRVYDEKDGTTPLVDVVGYAERVDTPGLVFMDTPGSFWSP